MRKKEECDTGFKEGMWWDRWMYAHRNKMSRGGGGRGQRAKKVVERERG
jgi:hypothetical protein